MEVSDLEKVTTVYKEIGIEYTIRNKGKYSYLFIGKRRDMYAMTNNSFESYKDGDLETMLSRETWMEFCNGRIESY